MPLNNQISVEAFTIVTVKAISEIVYLESLSEKRTIIKDETVSFGPYLKKTTIFASGNFTISYNDVSENRFSAYVRQSVRNSLIGATLGRTAGQNSALADGTNTQVLTRSVHRTGRRGMSQVQIGVANFKLLGVSPFGEAATGGTATVSAALELADGTLIVVNFGHLQSVDLLAGSPVVFCDPIGVYIPPDTEFYVRTWYRVANTTIALGAAQTVSVASKQIARKGTDLSAAFITAGYPSGTTSTQIPPVAIIGKLDGPSMCLAYFGDSIGDGSGDVTTDTPHGETSFIGRSLVNINGFNIPHVKMTRGGETLSGMASPSTGWRRNAMLGFATHMLCEALTNDGTQNRTVAQSQADCITEWKQAKACGIMTLQTTIAPRVSFAGSVQTPFPAFVPTGVSWRDEMNSWLIAQEGKGLLDKLIDIRPAIEDVKNNPGYWKNGLTDTADGTHPEAVAHARISEEILKPVFRVLENEVSSSY